LILDLDIYRTANLLTRKHGDKAAILAAMRADELLEAGSLDGAANSIAATAFRSQ